MKKDFYDTVYEKEIDPLVISLEGDNITMERAKMFDYLCNVDVIEFVSNKAEDEFMDGEEQTDEEYLEMYYNIMKALDHGYINPFDWGDYAEVYYGYITV